MANTGKDFEQVIAKMYSGAQHGLRIKPNHKEPDRSGRTRQVDVLLEMDVQSITMRIAVECRDFARKITIDKIEAFRSKIDSLGYQQGIMISRIGFDAGAKAKAKELRIRLLNYRIALRTDWERIFPGSAKVIVARCTLTGERAVFILADGKSFPAPEAGVTPILNADGIQLTTARQAALDIWREHVNRLGENTINFSSDEPLYFSHGGTLVLFIACSVTGLFGACVVEKAMPVEKGEALANADSDSPETMQLTSVVVDTEAAFDGSEREISQEEYARLVKSGLSTTPLKRYLRLNYKIGNLNAAKL